MSDEKPFSLEEATIDQLHEAIRAGRTTCVSVVQHYLDRVRAYNGVASLLVTENGAPIPEGCRHGSGHGAAAVPGRDRRRLDDLPRSRRV
jgi:amidase